MGASFVPGGSTLPAARRSPSLISRLLRFVVRAAVVLVMEPVPQEPGTIVVRLTERRPFAVWQIDGKFMLVDRDGKVVADSDVATFAGQCGPARSGLQDHRSE